MTNLFVGRGIRFSRVSTNTLVEPYEHIIPFDL
jgi:hypothetical protein